MAVGAVLLLLETLVGEGGGRGGGVGGFGHTDVEMALLRSRLLLLLLVFQS